METGISPANYSVLIYDKTFVSQNFADYGNLKGVFTLSQENVEARQKAEAAAQERTQVAQMVRKLLKPETKAWRISSAAGEFQKRLLGRRTRISQGL